MDSFNCQGAYRRQITARAMRDGMPVNITAVADSEVAQISLDLPLSWGAANLRNNQTHELASVLSAPGLLDLQAVRSVAMAVPECASTSPGRTAAGSAQVFAVRGFQLGGDLSLIRVGDLAGLAARRLQCAPWTFWNARLRCRCQPWHRGVTR